MPEGEELGDTRPRPSGRRAAPASRAGALLAPALPLVAAAVAWLTRHRIGALVAVTGLAVVGMLVGAVALMQSSGGGAPENEAFTTIDDPRPSSTTPSTPSPFGPVLPTSAPPTALPEPSPEPDEIVEPPADDAPVEPTATPEPTDDHPGQGRGPKKPKGPGPTE
ncbi:hypothetical protein ACWGST_02415 [Agromyces sp. NPDC055520]